MKAVVAYKPEEWSGRLEDVYEENACEHGGYDETVVFGNPEESSFIDQEDIDEHSEKEPEDAGHFRNLTYGWDNVTIYASEKENADGLAEVILEEGSGEKFVEGITDEGFCRYENGSAYAKLKSRVESLFS